MLRYGQYGFFAVRDNKGPPAPSDPLMDLQFYTRSELGPW
jgi:hypothetical protein